MTTVSALDLGIIAIYFVGMLVFGWWLSRRSVHNGDDYFLAGRSMTWPFIGSSLFSTNISSQQFIGQAGMAFAGGIAVGTFQMIGGLCFGLLALFFVDTYRNLRIYTAPEFFERRYNRACRKIISMVNVMMIMLATVSAALYAGSVVVLTLLGKEATGGWLIAIILLIGLIAGGYTLMGGLAAVIYTDFVQNILLILGGTLTLILGVQAIGGIGVLTDLRTATGDSPWLLVHPADHKFGWLPVATGVLALGIHGHCTDHDYVQRVLAAKSQYHAKMGAVFAGILKVAALFICAVPGVVAAKLFADGTITNSDQAYVSMMIEVLPMGVLGLCLAGLLAAIMSSVDSGLCAASSLVTYDFLRPRDEASEQLKVGRKVIGVLLLLAILWAPMIGRFQGLFGYLMALWTFMAPPVVVCVLAGIFYPKANAKAAVATLIVGVILGAYGFFGIDYPKQSSGLAYLENPFNIGFLTLIACTVVMLLVSQLTQASEADLKKTTAVTAARKAHTDDMSAAEKRIFHATLWALGAILVGVTLLFSPIGIGK